jgi:ADP-heptose:LPS heptosyltransferase
MRILIYKEDGLGDTFFSIPTLKFLNDINIQNLNIFFYSKYSDFLENLFENELKNLKFLTKNEIYNSFFNTTIFLGPIAKFFKDIIFIKSPKKYSIIYKNKILANLILRVFTNTISFEKVNPILDNEIFNIFNLIYYIFKLENLIKNESILKKEDILGFYSLGNFNFFYSKIQKNIIKELSKKYPINEEYIILHITYKSFFNGLKIEDYFSLIKKLISLDKYIFIIFGPLELKYLQEFKKFDKIKDNKIFLIEKLSLTEYIGLCYKAKVFIGFDTGACHLAAFSNTKKIISLYPDKIFNYNSIRYAPLNKFSQIINLPYSYIKHTTINNYLI